MVGRCLARTCEQRIGVEQKTPRAKEEGLTRRRRPNARGVAGEKIDAQRELEIPDVATKGRLVDVYEISRPAKAAVIGGSNRVS